MSLRSLSLLFLQTVAAAPTLVGRQDLNGASCPSSDGLVVVRSGKSWTIGCGKDAYGNDIGAAKQFSSFDQCIQACGKDKACVSVAYEGTACYLKSKTGTKSDKASVWGAFIIAGSGPGPNSPRKPTDGTGNASAAASVAAPSAAAPSVAAQSAAQSEDPVAAASASSVAAIEKAKAPAVASVASPKASSAPVTSADGSCARPAAKSLSTKRGASYNSIGMLGPLAGKISWAYNWGAGPDGTVPSGVQYVPMLWGGDSTRGNAFKAAAASAVAAGADTLLGFNEPDLAAQANMLDPSTAVAAWKQYMEPLKCTARLAAPAVTNGGSPMGLTYLKSFLSACSGCTIDVVPIHWYDSASNVAYFKQYVQDAYVAGGNRPIWITEFGASGSDADVATFLKTVIPWLDSQGYVERYSYFMAATGSGMLLSSSSQLSTVGQAYASS